MAEKARDPWEGTELFPPTESNSEHHQTERAKVRPTGQPEEHRAEIIITLAVIGLFPVFGLLALVTVAMAWIDLRKMSQGRMDRAGRTQTIVGLSLGIIEIIVIASSIVYFAIRGAT